MYKYRQNLMNSSMYTRSKYCFKRIKHETGRSMVEMLGVLAIVGVLSVGGVYGYGVAMKKHKANELLHRASMLATTISAQAMSNDGKLPETITDFGNTNYGTFSTSATNALNGKGFSITIENVDSAVCDQLKEGGMVQGVECVDSATSGKKDAKITYYKNLATNEAEGEKSPTGGSGSTKGNPGPSGDEDGAVCSGTRPGDCSVCRKNYVDATSGEWFDSDALCTEPGQTCVDGGCVESAKDEPTLSDTLCKCMELWWGVYYCGGNDSYNCSTDADCKKFGTWDDTQEKCVVESFCTNNSDCTSDEYCHYSSVDSSICKPNKKGICVAKADAKGSFASGTTAEADGFIRSARYMDWFSAQNFCRSYGKNLVALSHFGINFNSDYCVGNIECGLDSDSEKAATKWSAIQAKFGNDFMPWTANLKPSFNPRSAFFVFLNSSFANVNLDDRANINYALCR